MLHATRRLLRRRLLRVCNTLLGGARPQYLCFIERLSMLHSALVADGSSGHAEYATLALVCIAAVNAAAACAVWLGRSPRVFEAASGVAVALACIATMVVRGTYFPRQVLATVLMAAWSLRLSAHLARRGARKEVLNVGVRVVWGMFCATPVIVCNTRQHERYDTTSVEACAFVLAVAACILEAAADAQKQEWHAAHPVRPGKGDVEPPVCATGLWAWCRCARRSAALAASGFTPSQAPQLVF
jgi:steroid 5-alpha reductase family enzyme